MTRTIKQIKHIGHDFDVASGQTRLEPSEQHELLKIQKREHWLTCVTDVRGEEVTFFCVNKETAQLVELAHEQPVYILTRGGVRIGPVSKLVK